MIIKLGLPGYNDRQATIVALANGGYKVWVEQQTYLATTTYYVCFEYSKYSNEKVLITNAQCQMSEVDHD